MNKIKSIQNGYNGSATVRIFEELLKRKSLDDRLLPILGELLWMVQGCKDADQQKRTLPDYCYNILRVLQKVHFRVLPDVAAFGPNVTEIDWEGVGRMVGAAMRCLQFGSAELEKIAPRELWCGAKTPDASEIASAKLPKDNLESALMPGSPDASEKQIQESLEKFCAGINSCQQFAFNSGPGAMARLIEGIQKGLNGFLDESGQLAAEHPRDNIYWFLLLVWPEIQEMQQSAVQKTRKDFADWIEPFAAAGWVSIRDLGQLLDVCDDIGLKFKGRGAPRKKQLFRANKEKTLVSSAESTRNRK
jgi:hypothetical protein